MISHNLDRLVQKRMQNAGGGGFVVIKVRAQREVKKEVKSSFG